MSAGILRLLYGEADDIWLQGMGPDAAELAATGYAVRSLLGKALGAAGRHAAGTAARAEQLQVAAQLLRPMLLRRELAEVQGQHPIPPLHFTVNRIDLLHAHGAVNGLLVATARQVVIFAVKCQPSTVASISIGSSGLGWQQSTVMDG